MDYSRLFESLKSRRRWIAASIGILIVTVAVWFNTAGPDTPSQDGPSSLTLPEGVTGKVGEVQVTEEALKLAEIEVAPAELRQVREQIVATGTVKTGGNQLAKVTPHVAGEVTEIFVLPGAQVQQGQVTSFNQVLRPSLKPAMQHNSQAQHTLARCRKAKVATHSGF